MNTKFFNQFFYLSDETYPEFHDADYCDCAQPQSRPHSLVVASLYQLDVLGLQALDEALMGGDNDGFKKWLDFHNAQTYYGSGKQAAIAEALQQAHKDGKLIINHPEEIPCIFPLASTLRSVVGDGFEGDGCLPEKVCECNSTHTPKETVCRACYARLVCRVLHIFISAYLREHQSEGQN